MAKLPELKIKLPDTTWIFLCSGQGQHRHLLDIAWAVVSLRSRGVQDKNIFIFQDDTNYKQYLDDFAISGLVFDFNEFMEKPIETESSGVCFIVIAGHGSPLGIESNNLSLTPTDIFSRARSISKAQRCIIILGQCFGGIFEALDASSVPEIGVIAATELNLSMSNSLCLGKRDIKFTNNKGEVLKHWPANVFLFHFFRWLRQPEDIDGDKKYTLLDAYKYAGSFTNEDLSHSRLVQSLDLNGELAAAKEKLKKHNDGTVILDKLDLDALYDSIVELSTGQHIYSDPWILHAHLIRGTELDF